MDALAAARGREFDRLFLEGMIGHHQGALRMAETEAVSGIDVRVQGAGRRHQPLQSAEIALIDRCSPCLSYVASAGGQQ